MAGLKAGKALIGRAGNATEIIYTLDATDLPHHKASVGMWFLDCPGQAGAWRHFILGAVHLRPIENVKPAIITRPGSTHEILLVALDPAKHPSAMNIDSWTWLKPLNFVGQVRLASDEEAKSVLSYMAGRVVEGHLWAEPPLSGQIEPWESCLRSFEKGIKL